MTATYEGIELPRYSREIARTHHAGTHGAAARHRTFAGRLGRFAGVLTLRLAAHDWTPADLAHLTLTRLARPSPLQAAPHEPPSSSHDSPPADDPARTTEPTAADRTVDQPRVRDVLPAAPRTSADPASPTDRSQPDSHDYRGPFDVGVLLDGPAPPQPASVAGVGRGDGSEAPPEDATEPPHAPRSQARPSRPADGSTAGGPPPRTTVVRREMTTGPASTEGTATGGEAGGSPPSGALSNDDPPSLAVTHPTVTRTGDRPGRTPHRTMRVSRHHRRTLDPPDAVRFGDALPDDRGRTGATSGEAEPNAPPMLRPAGGNRDEPTRLEPLDGPATAASWPPATGASPSVSPASGTGDGPPDERTDGPPLVVRRHAPPGRSDPDGQLGGTPPSSGNAGGQFGPTDTAHGAPRARHRDDPSIGHPLSGTTNGSPAGRSGGASAGRRDARSPERLDELVDVDALVQRLTRAFERAARIERERRGR